MNHLMHTAVCALVVGLLTLGCFTLRYAFSPGDVQELIRRSEQNQRLEQASLRRQEGKRRAAQAYIAQRCTLAQTMQRWQESEQGFGQEWPVFRDILQQPLPWSDEERYYGSILAYVEVILRGQPEKLAAVLRRLEKEFQHLRADRKKPSTLPTKRTESGR